MQELVYELIGKHISRRSFFERMAAAGFSATAIESILSSVEAAETPSSDKTSAYRSLTATGGELWVCIRTSSP